MFNDYYAPLRAAIAVIGPLSFSSLALLIAALALLGDFTRDRIAVERQFHRLIRWAVRLLTIEVLIWIGVELADPVLRQFGLHIIWLVRSVRVLVLVGIALAALVLSSVLNRLITLLRTKYQP